MIKTGKGQFLFYLSSFVRLKIKKNIAYGGIYLLRLAAFPLIQLDLHATKGKNKSLLHNFFFTLCRSSVMIKTKSLMD